MKPEFNLRKKRIGLSILPASLILTVPKPLVNLMYVMLMVLALYTDLTENQITKKILNSQSTR